MNGTTVATRFLRLFDRHIDKSPADFELHMGGQRQLLIGAKGNCSFGVIIPTGTFDAVAAATKVQLLGLQLLVTCTHNGSGAFWWFCANQPIGSVRATLAIFAAQLGYESYTIFPTAEFTDNMSAPYFGDDNAEIQADGTVSSIEQFIERAERRYIENVALAKDFATDADEAETPPRVPLDWATLREPPPREWVLSQWLPDSHVALLSGRAGIGKTLIAQYIGTSVALGREYIAQVPQKRRVLIWAAEDDAPELWRRQSVICKHFKEPLSALEAKLFIYSYAGVDVTLAGTEYGALVKTPMLETLRQQVRAHRAEFVIVDNSARVFGGNENDRHSVTKFVAWLQAACAPAAVLLLSHPAKALGSEYSGSTAWEGAVRTRLYMSDVRPDAKAPKDEDDAPLNPTERYLSRRKANYSPLDCRAFNLTGEGLLVPVGTGAPVGMEYVQTTERERSETVIDAVRKLAESNVYGVAGDTSPNYLPKLAKKYKLLGRLTVGEFADHMRGMLLEHDLEIGPVGSYGNRHKREGIRVP